MKTYRTFRNFDIGRFHVTTDCQRSWCNVKVKTGSVISDRKLEDDAICKECLNASAKRIPAHKYVVQADMAAAE